MADEVQDSKGATPLDEVDLLSEEQPEKPRTPLEQILHGLKKAHQGSLHPSASNRKELGKDKSKSLFVLVAAAVVVLLFFLAVFSSPQKAKRAQTGARRGQPDLGRRATPGQEQQQDGSITPLLTADTRDQTSLNNGQVTPEDISRTSHESFKTETAKPNTTANTLIPSAPTNRETAPASAIAAPAPPNQRPTSQRYALNRIDFSDPALQQEYARAGYGPNYAPTAPSSPALNSSSSENDLKKPSLVFVRNENNAASLAARNPGGAQAVPAAAFEPVGLEEASLNSVLPAGTRLVARLQSAVSTAVAAPVVAAVEYNYERDGEIVVPAGSKALGKLQQANSSGYVSLHFDALELPDGTNEKMDGTAMSPDFGPVKGLVTGKKRGARFLVQTLTGMGTAAAYLVGAGSFSGALSESALLRERMAENVGIAGQNELNQLALNQNTVVTVPGNTRFYIVLQQTNSASGRIPAARRVSYASGSTNDRQSVPSLQELGQLLQLRQELSQLYQQRPKEKPASEDSQQQ